MLYQFLLSAFGEEYLEYRKKVYRYIGRRIKGVNSKWNS